MNGSSVCCDFCAVAIAPTDFERGQAVRLMGRSYCKRCLDHAIEKSRNPDARPDLTTPWPSNRFSNSNPDRAI